MLQSLRFKKSNDRCIVPVKVKSALDRPLSIKLCWRYQRHVAFAIGTTSNRSPSSRVWFVAAFPPMPTIEDLRTHQHLAARSATSSQFLFAEDITAKCITVAMKPLGGRRLASIRPLWLASFG